MIQETTEELQWKSNRELHTGFRLLPVSTTLNDCNAPPYRQSYTYNG